MNHCFDCNSSYTQPGTCNCFAPGGKRAPTTDIAIGTAPDAPALPQPTWVPPIGQTINVQPKPCPVCGKRYCYETHVVVSTSGAVVRYGPSPTVTLTRGID